MKKGLAVERISKKFGEEHVVRDVSLHVAPGEFFTLLGPSGCGKTTLLRMIAGLELPDSGKTTLGGKDITSLPASRRHLNMVFQSYALFPHLNVFDNVAFGLRSRKFPKDEVSRRVRERLEMLDLGKMESRRPHQLSGGQRQRVALARALVNEPEALLLDEPMSALDARLRARVQVDLRRLQKKLGQTFVMVTHDQGEAMAVSDRIAVMRDGEIIQSGTPEDVYDNPRTRFVAEFLGDANLIHGRFSNGVFETKMGAFLMSETPPWTRGMAAIRPEWIRIRDARPEKNGLEVTVKDVVYRGAWLDIRVEPGPLRVRTHTYESFNPGDRLWLELAPEEFSPLADS
ncbi:polyamine transporter subunit; ATP-binding component of ABC superfamily [Candidatus Desulfarcum epimagneticum]|uniref:Polyamine transporter subunit ATP-binding component of ABC superfamily n=1 Tax=uncultured Desulfobacteraceae bacterium TaxID=218296 RepID=A0A484HC04_9BACT|nr:polyamine transporter subunit; ATP-binding component of ABC superfamily [uncultured Desulfobacteraceae bacterium]